MTAEPQFFEKTTPSRRRINAEETAKGYRLSATAEGDDFIVKVSENDTKDLGKTVESTLGASLASMIIETRKEFEKNKLALAIPSMVKFIEDQNTPPKVTKSVSEIRDKINAQYDKLKKTDADKESGK